MSRRAWRWIALAAILGFPSISSAALTLNVGQQAGVTQFVDTVTGFQTFGDDMAGMSVTATFALQLGGTESETAIWAATGVGSGAATGSNFVISEAGDTFTSNWRLSNTRTDEGALTSLLIDGFPGNTMFDRTFGGLMGTAGSAAGFDFLTAYDIAGLNVVITATYIGQVAITGMAPVGDLFRWLRIDISIDGGGMFNTDPAMSFRADTDNGLGARPTPEPGTLLLLSAGLLGAWYQRRRRA